MLYSLTTCHMMKKTQQFPQPFIPRGSQENYNAESISLSSKQAHTDINATPWSVFVTKEAQTIQQVVLHFKTSPCTEFSASGNCYSGRSCWSYHSASERRRPPFVNGELVYGDAICPMINQGLECNNRDQCSYSHNMQEISFHPAKYKTSLCPKSSECADQFCPLAHSQGELRSIIITQSYTKTKVPNTILQPIQQNMPLYYVPSVEVRVQQLLAPYTQSYYATNSQYAQNTQSTDTELSSFKTKPCPHQYQHNHKHCIYFHSSKDRRRIPGKYSADRCEENENECCILGDSCPKSHSMVEKLYHPDKYKTKYCNNYPNRLTECEYGEYCCFAHSDDELKVELIHTLELDEDFFMFYFKTVWCPYMHEHNKAVCVYAHNWQDFRRKPNLFYYSCDLCPNWQSESFICEYKEGCPFEQNCLYCHGWKEQLYHPHIYKTRPCPDIKKCQKSLDCPYFHDSYDRRYPNMLLTYLPHSRDYKKNPNITISNNINSIKEFELEQISKMRPTAAPSFIPKDTTRRSFSSSEVLSKSSLIEPQGRKSDPHKSQNIMNEKAANTKEIRPSQPQSLSIPLKYIREESPESKEIPCIEDKKLFEIFSPTTDSGNNNLLLFTPSRPKAKHSSGLESTLIKPISSKEEHAFSSFSLTPSLQKQTFKKSSIFEKFHLDQDEPKNKDQEKDSLKKLFYLMGLETVFPNFESKSVNDILKMKKEEFTKLGINKDNDIEKLKQNLEEKHSEEEHNSSSIFSHFS